MRFLAVADSNADGIDDTWSAEVAGTGCTEVGTASCAWNGEPIEDTTVRRDDGCSNLCEVK